MQVGRQPRIPEILWSDQATSATAQFHRMPVDRAICTAVMSRDHNAFSWPEKSLDQFSVSHGAQGDNATSMVVTDDALLGLAANHGGTANDFLHSPAPSDQWYQSYCDQQSFVPYSRQPAHVNSSTADSLQWYEGARPITRGPAILNSNNTPAHVTGNVLKSLGTNGVDPWFLARHSQDDYLKNPEQVAADLNNRIVDVKSCMRETFPGYDARPLLPDHNVVNGGLPAYNRADPPRHVTVGADYCRRSLAPAGSLAQQSGNSKYSASTRQQAVALSNHLAGADGGFLPAHSGSDSPSYSPSETSEEVVKTTDIGTALPAKPGQRVDEPASGSSSPDVSLASTANDDTAVCDNDSDYSLSDLQERVEEACAMVERVLREREEREEFEADLGQRQRVDEPASGSSSPDVFLASTANDDTAVCDSDSDYSLSDLLERVEEACAMVDRVLREREEREEFLANLRQRENEVRADQKRKQQAREAKELENSQSWPARQSAVTTQNLKLCKHYKRHCQVKFECCNLFYDCHRCHNDSDKCSNAEVEAFQATDYKCSYCHHEEKIDENSQHCSSCAAKMSAYFCVLCKHFTCLKNNPYHCEKCGVCRTHEDKSFHCDVCNLCMDKRLEGNHKCRPDSGHDTCSICLEDAFSGCQILPCSHKIHAACVQAMLENGIITCPVCRHPLNLTAPY